MSNSKQCIQTLHCTALPLGSDQAHGCLIGDNAGGPGLSAPRGANPSPNLQMRNRCASRHTRSFLVPHPASPLCQCTEFRFRDKRRLVWHAHATATRAFRFLFVRRGLSAQEVSDLETCLCDTFHMSRATASGIVGCGALDLTKKLGFRQRPRVIDTLEYDDLCILASTKAVQCRQCA